MQYTIIKDKTSLVEYINILRNQSEFVYDIETNSLDTHGKESEIVGLGFCFEEGKATYIPFNGEILPRDIIDLTSSIFQDESIKKAGHNIKFDSRALHRAGINIKNIYFDTMVAAYCLYGDRIGSNLDDLTLHHLNHIKIRTKTLIPKKNKANPNPNMKQAAIDAVGIYCCEDVDYTFRLYKLFKGMLELPDNAYCKKLFYSIDMPLVEVLVRMECEGVKISETRLDEIKDQVSDKLTKLQQEIDSIAGRPVVLTKPADISNLLYNELKLNEKYDLDLVLTESGQASTGAATLEKYKEETIVDKILEYKLLGKLMSTYITAIPEYISRHTGLLHPFFGQTATSTGRLNSSNPNCQNIPARTKIGKQLREVFVSRFPNGKILAVDYSQAELRILAHMSKESIFIRAYTEEKDIHTMVASEVVFEKDAASITVDERAKVKTVNFGLLYGMRAKKLSLTLKIPIEEADLIMSKYMSRLGKLKNFLDTARLVLSKQGYTESYFGRRRYIPKIYSSDKFDQWAAEREAANHIIQGTNADIIRIAMVRIQSMLDSNNYKSKMILQVHDELVFDLHPDEINILPDKIKNIMQTIVEFDITMRADAKIGNNWSEAH